MGRMEELKQMADESAKKAIIRFNEENEDTGSDLSEDLTSPALHDEDPEEESHDEPVIAAQSQSTLQDINAQDIFEDFGEEAVKRGEVLKYLITKFGQHLITVDHPYSWELIRKNYGAGTYTVSARSSLQHRFLKRETRVISGEHNQVVQAANPPPPPPQGPSINEVLSLIAKQQESSKREAEEARKMAKEEANVQLASMSQMFQTLVTVMAGKSEPKDDRAIELFKMQMEMQAKMNQQMMESTKEMIKTLSDKIEKIGSQKSDSMDAKSLIEMQERARKSGMEMMSEMTALAEKKAAEKTSLIEELREEIRASKGEDSGKKSMSESIIESMLPLVAGAVAQKGLGVPAAPPPSAQQLALARKREAQVKALREKKLLEARNQKLIQQEALKRGESLQTPDRGVGAEGASEEVKKENSEFPSSFGKLGKAPRREVVEPLPEILEGNTELRAYCEQNLPSILGQMMMESKDPEDASIEVINNLKNNGFSAKEFLVAIKAEDLTKVADDYNLPAEAKVWLNNLYGNIEKNS